jgi:hypothetical protein
MKRSCLVLVMLMSGGCSHLAGEQPRQEIPAARWELSPARVSETIVKGKTTKKEIIARLGAPNSVLRESRPAGQAPEKDAVAESWNYWTAPPLETLGQGGRFQIFRLTVGFDATGVARDYLAQEKTITME